MDDDPIIRAGISKIIETSGEDYEIVGQASDGELALEKIKEAQDIDLILTDIRMPIMDGLELIREVRKFNTQVKIVVLSGFDDYNYVRNAFMDGAIDYVLKPIVKKDFLDLMKKIEKKIEDETRDNMYGDSDGRNLVKKYLIQLAHRKYQTEEEFEEILQALHLERGVASLVMALKVNKRLENFHEQNYYEHIMEESLVKLKNIFSLDQKFRILCFTENNRIIIFVSALKQTEVAEAVDKYYLYIKNTPLSESVTFTMGVSDVYDNMERFSQMYQESISAVEHCLYAGCENVIHYRETLGSVPVADFDWNRERLSGAFELCDYVGIKHELDDIFNSLRRRNPEEVRKHVRLIIEYLILNVKDFQTALTGSQLEYEFFIRNVTTFDEMKERLYSASKTLILSMKAERESRSESRIEIAKAYMEQHYMEMLTLNQVAEHVELNPSYFSNLFKKETDVNFSEYLLNVRINMAKKLLLDPTIKVYEIGNMVGYEDAISFGRAFKKKIGMSPKEYRNTVC